jgi:SNF2 family DNA or RNA helicase
VRRWFARAANVRGGLIRISDTPENCRELETILSRYPLAVSHPDKLWKAAREFDRVNEAVGIITATGYVPREFELAKPLREYQRTAIDLLLTTGSLLCADQVGLGKTLVAIGTCREPQALPMLVITKTELPAQWQEKFAEFAPDLRTWVIKNAPRGQKMRQVKGKRHFENVALDLVAQLERGVPFPDVVIMSYSRFNSDWVRYLQPHIRTIVYDEIQEMRTGPGTQRYMAGQTMATSTRYKLGLSATPIYNLGGEAYNVIDVLGPDLIGTRDEFQREWCTYAAAGKLIIKEPNRFGSYLRERGIMLRRTREEVGRELPPLEIIPHPIQANLAELKSIDTDAARLAELIVNRGGTTQERFKAAGVLDWKLRQATGIAKAPYVAEFVSGIVATGEKVLLYGWHHETYRLWGDLLKEHNPLFYTGKESVATKRANVQRFIDDPTCKVLILSLRAGAGLDGLQGAVSQVVFGELDWSPGVHEQCMGRAHRDGQTNPVSAWFLHCADGSDPVIMDTLNLKQMQAAGILRPDGNKEAGVLTLPSEAHGRRLAEFYLARHRGIHAA